MMHFVPQLHIVHIKEKYDSLKEALNDSTGVAAFAFFFEVLVHLWYFICLKPKHEKIIWLQTLKVIVHPNSLILCYWYY